MYINFFCFYRERERALAQAGAPVIQPQRTDGPRFTGGGFNLKSTKTAAWSELSLKIADPACDSWIQQFLPILTVKYQVIKVLFFGLCKTKSDIILTYV